MRHVINYEDGYFNMQDQTARLAAYAIDQLATQEVLDYKRQPDVDLIELFTKYISDHSALKDQVLTVDVNANFMKQRRLMITPTVDYYQVEVEDETCLALRKYRDHISRFVRVTFSNEYLTRGFYQQQTDGG